VNGVSYDELVAAATVGVSRRPVHIAGLTGAAAAYAGVVDQGDAAAGLLDAAALLASAWRAGVQPASGVACREPAGPDAVPELPARAGEALAQVVPDTALLADLLTAAADAGYRAPAPLLVTLLDAAAKNAAVRPAVAAVLGTRGRWLARHRADWRKVSGEAAPENPGGPEVWETGSRTERLGYLVRLRTHDPAAARDLLGSSWAQETGDDRAYLLTVLRHGLGRPDEPFLEAALDDRKSTVRAVAAKLLAQLPDSRFNHRNAARAAALLHVERSGLRRQLVASPPDPSAASEVRDGMPAAPPSPAIGASAWLLTRLIAAAPLAGWVTRFGLTPQEIVSLPVRNGLAADVHAGWRMAAISQASQEWAQALLAPGTPGGAGRRPPAAWPEDHKLATVLPSGARADRAAALLTRSPGAHGTLAEVAHCPVPWPEPLGAAMTADGRTTLKSPSGTMSPAEAISVITQGMALAAHFGDGVLRAADVAAGIVGAVIKDPVTDAGVWGEYLEAVVRERRGWGDFYRACREVTG
jgi:Family of unknown function (DUF5691)